MKAGACCRNASTKEFGSPNGRDKATDTVGNSRKAHSRSIAYGIHSNTPLPAVERRITSEVFLIAYSSRLFLENAFSD